LSKITNPFTPSTGATPPLLVGRQSLLDFLQDGLDEGPGSPSRITLYTGARGVGKTVMLTEATEIALRNGWLYIDETATEGLIGRLDEQVSRLIDQREPRGKRKLTAVSGPFGLGATTQLTPELTVGLRYKITRLLELVKRNNPDGGLMITLDEVQSGVADLRQLGPIIQHLIREGQNIACVMAGLPSAVAQLLRGDNEDKVLTFLRRADKWELADVPINEVRDSFDKTFSLGGKELEPNALDAAAEATYGYPFLIQLVGYHVWRSTEAKVITLADVERGVEAARRRLGSLVHETALADLSNQDRTFLVAMSQDEGASRIRDIRHRMNISGQHANVYRERLLAAKMIIQPEQGWVDFALPYLRSYLREHGAAYLLASD